MQKKLKTLLLWLSWFVFGFLIIFSARRYAFNFLFQDETDHTVVGEMVLDGSKKLYSDIVTIHQPLPVLIGGLISQNLNQETLYSYISRLRFVMSLVWFAGGTLLLIRFRSRGLAVNFFSGLASQVYFGFFVLPESLVISGVAFMMLILIETLFHREKKPGWWPKWLDLILWGFFAFFLPFNLLPTAPFVLITSIIYFWRGDKKLQEIALAIGSGLTCLVGLMLIVNPFDWYRETIHSLLNYWLPNYANQSGFLYNLLYPFYHWQVVPASQIAWIWLAAGAIILTNLVILTIKKKYKTAGIFLLLYVIVFLLNNRTVVFGGAYFEGFHLYPYAIAMVTLAMASWCQLAKFLPRKIWLVLSALLLALSVWSVGKWLYQPHVRQDDYEINVLPQQNLINVINTLKSPGDTLFTGTDGFGNLNLLTELPLADKQNFHLDWAWESPELRADFYKTFQQRPPAFIYFLPDGGNYKKALEPILEEQYLPLDGFEGTKTHLYIRKDKAMNLPEKNWQDYQNYWFTLPQAIQEKQQGEN